MFHSLHSRVRVAEHTGPGRSAVALPLLLVSSAGVVVSGLIWATSGWVDGLACYLATVAALGLLLLRMANSRPRKVSEAREPVAAPRDAAASVGARTGLSLAKPESGLRRVGG